MTHLPGSKSLILATVSWLAGESEDAGSGNNCKDSQKTTWRRKFDPLNGPEDRHLAPWSGAVFAARRRRLPIGCKKALNAARHFRYSSGMEKQCLILRTLSSPASFERLSGILEGKAFENRSAAVRPGDMCGHETPELNAKCFFTDIEIAILADFATARLGPESEAYKLLRYDKIYGQWADRSSATVMADRYCVFSACASSHSVTRGSDTTLV